MSEEFKIHESTQILCDNLAALASPDGIQRYILGTKKNGQPRAVYDVIKDCLEPKKKSKKKDKKKKKNKKKAKNKSTYSVYVDSKKSKKATKSKYWHI